MQSRRKEKLMNALEKVLVDLKGCGEGGGGKFNYHQQEPNVSPRDNVNDAVIIILASRRSLCRAY